MDFKQKHNKQKNSPGRFRLISKFGIGSWLGQAPYSIVIQAAGTEFAAPLLAVKQSLTDLLLLGDIN